MLGRTVKRLALSTGLYRPARWASRRLRVEERREFSAHVAYYRSLLPAGGRAFDVGANIGEHSEAMLEAGLRVVAFEPNPRVLPELRARCARYRSWQMVPCALGSSAAIATLYARAAHGQSSLLAGWEGETIGEHIVPVVTLDAAIERFGVPDLIKIDVEGYELDVLRGLSCAIHILSFEFHLTSSDIAKTRACLDRLCALIPTATVNMTRAEVSEWLWPEWRPIQAIAATFPDGIHLNGAAYGDLVVCSH